MIPKKVPCEECRNQKRKCSGQKPCERCYKFGLDCIYTVLLSPMDEEFVHIAKQKELLRQAHSIESEIKGMEMEMRSIHNTRAGTPSTMSIPSLTDDSDKSVIDDFPHLNLSSQTGPQSKLLAISNDGTSATLKNEKKAEPWILCVKSGDFSIDTKIKNYSDMLDNLYHILHSVEYGFNIPSTFNSFVVQDAMINELNILIRKKYGKTHCKNVARSVRIFVTPSMNHVDTMVVARSHESIQTTTNRLIGAYLRCQHLQQLAIHVPTFFKCFMDTSDSAARMSLCAMICTLRCKHIAECLPSASLVEYGKFYFERARESLSDAFDQYDLGTFNAYVFMATYKFAISEPEEGRLYADMADRISIILKPTYAPLLPMKDKGTSFLVQRGEAVHFSRLLNHLHKMQTFEEICRATTSFSQIVEETRLPYCVLTHSNEGKWEIAEDDSEQEKQFAQMHSYILNLQRTEREASKNAYSCDLFHLVGLIGHQVEMSMRHWYIKILPPHFRLSLPLFDPNVDSQKFYSTLERECAHSPIPILTTLAVYEEWIIMGQSYLPKGMPQPENEWNLLKTHWSGGRISRHSDISPKWRKRIQKLIDLRDRIRFEGTDEEYVQTLDCLWSTTETHANKNIIITAVDCAFITVRLAKYLRSRSDDCYFDMRILVNAWQLLLTVSKIQVMMAPEIVQVMPRVHKCLSECLEMVHDELKLQPYQGKVSDFVATMERELKTQTVEEDCDCVACPDA